MRIKTADAVFILAQILLYITLKESIHLSLFELFVHKTLSVLFNYNTKNSYKNNENVKPPSSVITHKSDDKLLVILTTINIRKFSTEDSSNYKLNPDHLELYKIPNVIRHTHYINY